MNFVLHREQPPKTKGTLAVQGTVKGVYWNVERKGHQLVVHAASCPHRDPLTRQTTAPDDPIPIHKNHTHSHTTRTSTSSYARRLKPDAGLERWPHLWPQNPGAWSTQKEDLKWRFLTGTAAGEHKARATICLTRVKAVWRSRHLSGGSQWGPRAHNAE